MSISQATSKSPSTFSAPDDQSADFVELFFDLVFVFAITQVTFLTAHHLNLQGILRSLLIFWLIWGAWTQFTWTANSIDLRSVGTRIAFFIAIQMKFMRSRKLYD